VRKAGACCAGSDIRDARDVAAKLGIPHFVLDYETRFRESVIQPFAESYARGETPVPCIACNQTVKFSDLLETARDLGGTALVTGHYIESRALPDGHRGMFRARDPERDQSYFLYATTQAQLDFLRFPLGSLEKREVRALAQELGLAVATKRDSQDICFVPSGRYAEIVERLKPEAAAPGEIVHLDGRVLGEHAGVMRFTIGQRRGLTIATGEPLYVVRIDAAARQVVVGPREALLSGGAVLRDLNWLGGGVPRSRAIHARVRSTRAPGDARLEIGGSAATVRFPAGEESVAPGQACVFYDTADARGRVLGGGVIASVLPMPGSPAKMAQRAPALAE
jgi:tRNA-specific 2-thiouridylase